MRYLTEKKLNNYNGQSGGKKGKQLANTIQVHPFRVSHLLQDIIFS